jgi:Ca2+-transporting ATPase
MGLYYSFLFALGIAASMVPQGLPAQINTALTIASSRLALHNILLKKLSSAETMGAVSVICTDKTGTLTKNEMTIQHIFVGYHQLKVS